MAGTVLGGAGNAAERVVRGRVEGVRRDLGDDIKSVEEQLGNAGKGLLGRIVDSISRIFEKIRDDAAFKEAQGNGRIMPPDAEPVAAGAGDVPAQGPGRKIAATLDAFRAGAASVTGPVTAAVVAPAAVSLENPSRIDIDPATGARIVRADALVSPAVTAAQSVSVGPEAEAAQKYANNIEVLSSFAAGGGDGQGVGTDVYQRAQNLFTMTGSFEQAASGGAGKPSKPTVVHAAVVAPKTPGLG